MGRSTASCFKIIACGGSSVDECDADAPESKGSSDKRGWSFRKRSARHRVLSNTVISETPSSLNKESPETATINFQTQPNTNFPEKTSPVLLSDEKPQILTSDDLKVSDTTVVKSDDKMPDNIKPEESVVIVIQAAIRGILARREMLKLKNVIKLQAAVRGHLVRRQAVGTLRCIQAIVKMQALVRARQAHLSEGPSKGKANAAARPDFEFNSIEKLLSNKFAHQLLESAPRTKSINVKCDPYRSDSAWNWLERWMSVSSMGVEQPQKPESNVEPLEQDKVECAAYEVAAGCPAEVCEFTDVKADKEETGSEENLITYEADNFDFQACHPTPSSKMDDPVSPQPDNSGKSNSKESSSDLLSNQTIQSDSISQVELQSVTSKPEIESEQSTRSLKRPAPEQVENEGRKFVFGARKSINPAFVAVQSKFKELSSTANSARSTSDVGVESNSDGISSGMENTIRTKDIGVAENSNFHTSFIRIGGSECGTELSISSTLDSPDSSDVGAVNVEQETEISEKHDTKNLDVESNGKKAISASDLDHSFSLQPEKLDNLIGATEEPVVSTSTVESLHEEPKEEKNASNAQIELKSEMDHQTCKSSPEASPRSHMTVPESQGTPSSQVSVKAGRRRSNRGASNHKRRSRSTGRGSPSNPNCNSCMDQLPKDHKAAKQGNSFGSPKPDSVVDQEPRASCSSNSLPNYMQATESARAKALANSSPRSSPDVQEKEIYSKKRNSLAGANGRQGAPGSQGSMSLAAKGNDHLRERKWQR
ncbi:hypothetical protein NMG60_11024418 [Bertholletia excelsa]